MLDKSNPIRYNRLRYQRLRAGRPHGEDGDRDPGGVEGAGGGLRGHARSGSADEGKHWRWEGRRLREGGSGGRGGRSARGAVRPSRDPQGPRCGCACGDHRQRALPPGRSLHRAVSHHGGLRVHRAVAVPPLRDQGWDAGGEGGGRHQPSGGGGGGWLAAPDGGGHGPRRPDGDIPGSGGRRPPEGPTPLLPCQLRAGGARSWRLGGS